MNKTQGHNMHNFRTKNLQDRHTHDLINSTRIFVRACTHGKNEIRLLLTNQEAWGGARNTAANCRTAF